MKPYAVQTTYVDGSIRVYDKIEDELDAAIYAENILNEDDRDLVDRVEVFAYTSPTPVLVMRQLQQH